MSVELVQGLEQLWDAFLHDVGKATTELEIRTAQASFQRRVKDLMKLLRELPPEEKKRFGEAANKIKDRVLGETEKRLAGLAARARQRDLERVIDVTMPGRSAAAGHLHLLTQVRREMVAIFAELGFELAVGPQAETDFHNFEALAIPQDHPARAEQDTFYLEDDLVLRTHTSPVQIRTMLSRQPPVKIIAPGVVYRRDDDATHSPMFMQIEGLLVDEGVRFSDLKGTLLHFVKRFFGMDLGIRFRASYFPFVEPGAEVDMECTFCRGRGGACRLCKGTGFLEIGGSGMVDPRVFEHVAYDSERYTGFAFGMGIERMAMLRHGVNDIKLFYEGDVRFLRQF